MMTRTAPALRHPLARTLLGGVAALVAAPVISLALIAIGGDAALWPHLAAYVIPPAALDTLLLLAGVAVVCMLAGIGTAWIVTTYEFPCRRLVLWLLPLPLAFPTYIVAYVYADLLGGLGPVQSGLRALFGWRSAADYWFPNIRSLGGAVLIMGAVLYPYVYLAARAMFETQSVALIESARGLGATPWRIARDIALPMARPAIAAGVALALLEAVNDVGASEYLGIQTLTLAIFTTWLNRSSLPGAAQIACLLLLAVCLLLALERGGRARKRFTGLDARPGARHRAVLPHRQAWLALAACVVPILFGFVVPLIHLAHEVIGRGLRIGFDPSLARHALTTVWLASCATVLVVLLGFAAALAQRRIADATARVCFFIAGLGYALPGTVLALGLLSPLIAIDEAINAVTHAFGATPPGLVLAGSSAAIICAYVIRFLSISTGFAQAGLARIATELDDAARIAGARATAVTRSIHLPLLQPALWAAALLVFVDCLKELPATLLLRPLNLETLSTYIYQFAARGNFEEGAMAALLIVLVGLAPVIVIIRQLEGAAPRPAIGSCELSPAVAR
jgi:iron(III) transport system permease protein